MNLNEHANYMLALLLSLALHFLLLLLLMPGYLATKPTDLETFPVGLVEIAAGSPDGTGGMMGSLPEETMVAPSVNNLDDVEQDKGKTVVKPKVALKSSPEDKISIPKKDEKGVTDDHGKKPIPGGTLTGGSGGTGDGGNLGNGKPFGFGSGEGMVTVLGPLPPYPKNAMNEGKEGSVTVRVLVKADGSLEAVNVTQPSSDIRLDKTVVSTIKRTWKFKPVTKDYYIDLIFSFNIDSGVTRKFLLSESRP